MGMGMICPLLLPSNRNFVRDTKLMTMTMTFTRTWQSKIENKIADFIKLNTRIHYDYHYLTSITKKKLHSKNTSKNKKPLEQQQFINFIIKYIS